MAQIDSGSGWLEQLPDGTQLRIRPIAQQDSGLELEFLNRLSPEYRSARFIGLIREPCPEVARNLTCVDPTQAVSFIAIVPHDGRERQIGAAQFYVVGDHCDASLTVADEWRRRGVGSALMRRLIEAAVARGVRRMRAYAPTQSGNSDNLAARIGFERRADPHDPATVVYELDLG